MNSRKAIGIIGEIFGFGFGMTIFFIMMLLMTSVGNQSAFERDIRADVNAQFASLKQNAVMTVFLEDRMWRHEEIPYDKYNNFRAKKVISLYFSSQDDEVWFGGKSYGSEEVREDIMKYTRFKMNRHWISLQSSNMNTPWERLSGYSAAIQSQNSERQPIEVGTNLQGTPSIYTYSIPKTGGGKVTIAVYAAQGGSGYGGGTIG